jgi:hypothetical protein
MSRLIHIQPEAGKQRWSKVELTIVQAVVVWGRGGTCIQTCEARPVVVEGPSRDRWAAVLAWRMEPSTGWRGQLRRLQRDDCTSETIS